MVDKERNEASAGGVLVRKREDKHEALLIRLHEAAFYELPKGHLEEGETPQQAALRELREETGLESTPQVGPSLGTTPYSFVRDGTRINKSVEYFLFTHADNAEPRLGPLPHATQELRWIRPEELGTIRLKHDSLRPIIEKAFQLAP